MADHFTACLQKDEPTVRQYLATHGHTYVATLGPYNGGDIILNSNDSPPPAACGGVGDPGPKVLVHTTAP